MLPSAVLLAYHARIMTAYPSRSPPQFSSFHMFSVQSNKRKRPNKQKINTSHVVCSYHLYQFRPDTSNSKYTCISASFLRTTVIGRMKLSISGMLGVQMHDWVHGQTNTSLNTNTFSHPSSSRIVDMLVESTLGGLGCSLRTWTMKIDLDG